MQPTAFWLTLISIGTLSFTTFFPQDTDLGWHLRYGQHLLQTGSPYYHNQLTYFLENYPWPHSYTLYQLATYLLWQTGQITTLRIATSLVLVALFLIIYQLNQRKLLPSLLHFIILLSFSLSFLLLGWRAQLFTLLGLALTLLFLTTSRFFFLPPLFALWANLHGGFILGFPLILLYLLHLLIHHQRRLLFPLASSFLLSLLAPLANPFGTRIYPEIARHTWYPLSHLIAEWVPPPLAWQILVAASFLLLSLITLTRPSLKTRLFLFLSLTLFTSLAITARRHLPLFGLIAGFTITQLFPLPPLKTPYNKFLSLALLLSLLLTPLLPSSPPLLSSTLLPCFVQNIHLPCQASRWLHLHPLPGTHVFAPFEWGGFLSWELPEYQYFADGRMPAWSTPSGKSPYTTYLKVIQAQPTWESTLKHSHTDWLLIGTGTFLDLHLKSNPSGWQSIYQDPIATIYTKKDS